MTITRSALGFRAMLSAKLEGATAKKKAETLIITRLVHDLKQRKSWVTMVWDKPPDRHISLEVPYGTSLGELYEEADKTVQRFSAEFAATKILSPEK